MARKQRNRKTHTVEISFSDEKVTSFGGMVLEHRVAERLGLWTQLEKRLPKRRGRYSWTEVIKSIIAGLLTGSFGTYATDELRGDQALLQLLDLDGAPEEVTVWRCLEGLGELAGNGLLAQIQSEWTRAVLDRMPRRDLHECDGFFPIFADGSLLEGSARREGTKTIKDKGRGLMWTTIFTGPLVAAQALANKGEGEQSLTRQLLPQVMDQVVRPLGLDRKALLLADSLHGVGPTLDLIESEGLSYVVGAGALREAQRVLESRQECEWYDLGSNSKRGWSSSAVCVCWVQCPNWPKKRLMVGRRITREGEMFPMVYGVITNLRPEDVGASGGKKFALKIWRLYDAKGGMELGYSELLSDLGLHHPPCQEHLRNAGFYAVATLAHTVGMALKLIAGRHDDPARRKRVREKRNGVPPRVRIRRGMRLWRLRRRLFAIPARVSRHARRLKVELLGVSPAIRIQFERWFLKVQRC